MSAPQPRKSKNQRFKSISVQPNTDNAELIQSDTAVCKETKKTHKKKPSLTGNPISSSFTDGTLTSLVDATSNSPTNWKPLVSPGKTHGGKTIGIGKRAPVTMRPADDTSIKKNISFRSSKPSNVDSILINKLKSINQGEHDEVTDKSLQRFIMSGSELDNDGEENMWNPLQDINNFVNTCSSLDKAIASLVGIVPDIEAHAKEALDFAQKTSTSPGDLQTRAAINLYTQAWDPVENSLYYILNKLLRSTMRNNDDKAKLKKFLPFLSLIHSALKPLQKSSAPVTVYRGVGRALHEEFIPKSRHTWNSFSSCALKADGIVAFMDKTAPRTVFTIKTYKGITISQFSLYPTETEVLLLPGTYLKVISQVNLGGKLHLIQLEEIPPQSDYNKYLRNDKSAIEFWVAVSNDSFSCLLSDFCESVMIKNNLPIIKRLDKTIEYTEKKMEAFQKYWVLWYFAGGSIETLNYYVKVSNDQPAPVAENSTITLEKFGQLISIGNFNSFLDELYGIALERKLFPDTCTGFDAGQLIMDAVDKNSTKSPWLVRYNSSQLEFPFTLSLNSIKRGTVVHFRIQYVDGVYSVILNEKRAAAHSLNALISRIISEKVGDVDLGANVPFAGLNVLFPDKPQTIVYNPEGQI